MEQPEKHKEHIIITGAGAAGLMAGRALSAHYRVTILEARNVLGGRIRTLHDGGFSRQVEQGAEFIHGKLPVSLALMKEAGLGFSEVEGELYQASKLGLKEQEEMIAGWDGLIKRMGEVKEDITMEVFLEKYYGEDKYALLRRRARNYVQGFDVADISDVSIKELYNEWANEDEANYRTDKGYDGLIEFLAAECIKNNAVIRTGTVVKQVEWKEGQITVATEDGSLYHAEKIIVTVPVSVLQHTGRHSSIAFMPAVNDYIAAAENIGFGNVVKVVLEFKEAFWEDNHKNTGFILSEEFIPTWWTQLPDKAPVLTGWLGGPPADAVMDESDEFILEMALDSLAKIFSTSRVKPGELLVSSIIINWGKDEWALGAYSYPTPETAKARKMLNIPIKNTLYFAGEALYTGKSPGTVEAALNSGKLVAEKILQREDNVSGCCGS